MNEWMSIIMTLAYKSALYWFNREKQKRVTEVKPLLLCATHPSRQV